MYFTDTPTLNSIEAIMKKLPYGSQRGGRRFRSPYKYTKKDCDCRLCLYYRKKTGCTAALCPVLDIRLSCGAASIGDAVKAVFKDANNTVFQKRLSQIYNRKDDVPMIFQSNRHKQIFETERLHLRKPTKKAFAVLYLLTADKALWQKTKSFLTNTGIAAFDLLTTIHKFMYIHELVQELKNKTFAVIIDEAHSSTAGAAMESVTYALSESKKLSEATPTDVSEEEPSMADLIEDEIARSGKQDNVSMIAFTATPKPTTLQLFGTLNEEGKKVAFDLYSMKQAIEEGFILDVLKNYVTYKTYYKINKAIEDDPELETIAAKRKIAKYIELHDTNIAQKVEIIIEHFKNHIMKELGGRAKAMVITSSRQAAVKYRNEFISYVTKHGYTGIHALVAFSGKVTLDGKEYTESVMNGISEEALPEAFDSNDYQVLLVANKYQTGFDQPKLCAMYVDKRLRGVSAVQTLSRLNRICAPFDKKTFVLDFKNEYDDIQKAFSPFYTETILNETITPSDIRAVEAQVDQYNFLDIDDIDAFNEYLYLEKRTAKDKAKMWSLLDKSLQIINKFGQLEKMEIRATIKRFIRFYSFLIQATCFENVDLHKKYNFLSYLVKEIEIGGGGNDFDIADKITASNFKQKKTGEETREIESKPEVDLPKPNEVFFDEAAKKKLSEIIDEINATYNKNFDVDVASKSALQMRDLLLKNGHLRDSARNNSLKDFKFAYFDAVQEALLEGYEQNQDFFALLLDNDEKKRELMQVFLEDVYKNLREDNE